MKANVTCGFSIAVLALTIAIPDVRISAAPDPQVKSGLDRLYVIDCGDGNGPDESRWTPRANVAEENPIATGLNRRLGSGTPNAVFVMSTVSKGDVNERRTNRTKEL